VEIFNREKFAVLSKDLTLSIQMEGKVFGLIMAAFSHVLVGVPVIVILIVHYLYQTKKDSFYNMLTLAVAINANVLSKLIVKEYRPFL